MSRGYAGTGEDAELKHVGKRVIAAENGDPFGNDNRYCILLPICWVEAGKPGESAELEGDGTIFWYMYDNDLEERAAEPSRLWSVELARSDRMGEPNKGWYQVNRNSRRKLSAEGLIELVVVDRLDRPEQLLEGFHQFDHPLDSVVAAQVGTWVYWPLKPQEIASPTGKDQGRFRFERSARPGEEGRRLEAAKLGDSNACREYEVMTNAGRLRVGFASKSALLDLGEPYILRSDRDILNELAKERWNRSDWREFRDRLNELNEAAQPPQAAAIQRAMERLDRFDVFDTVGEIVLRSPRFSDLVNKEVRREVEGREEEVERQIKDKRSELAAIHAEQVAILQQIRQREESLEQRESDQVARLETLATRIESGRQALVDDFYAMRPLLDGGIGSVAAVRCVPDDRNDRRSAAGAADVITRVLLPLLRAWSPGCRYDDAAVFFAAVVACRATLIPHEGWARVLAQALNVGLSVIHVEPTWLVYASGLERCLREPLREAQRAPDRPQMVALVGIDRPPSRAWASPLLSVLSGAADRLPEEKWPGNLRLLLTADGDESAFPVAGRVWADHCAAVEVQGESFSEVSAENSDNDAESSPQPIFLEGAEWERLVDLEPWEHHDRREDRSASPRAVSEVGLLKAVLHQLGQKGVEDQACEVRLTTPRRLLDPSTEPAT